MKSSSDKVNKKAFKLLLVSNKKKPNDPDILNYLGFTSRKLGEFEKYEFSLGQIESQTLRQCMQTAG